jgi:hypothetical protein
MLAPTGAAQATTVTDIVNGGLGTCAGGTATITGVVTVTDDSVLDFITAGCPNIVIASGGVLQTEDRSEASLPGCPSHPSARMTILGGDLTIKSGGSINGNVPGKVNGQAVHGGDIFIQLTATGPTTGALVIEPGGVLESNHDPVTAKGRAGNITVVADNQIWVQADPSGTPRGRISSNSQADVKSAFSQGCGRGEITLVATGNGPLAAGTAAIQIDGTVEMISPGGAEAFLGGIITMLAGADITNITTDINGRPFPSALPVTPPNPPQNNARVVIGATGLVNIDAKDGGGGEVRIYACFVQIKGLILVGGEPGGPFGREQFLPVIIAIWANETIDISMGGRVIGNLREGWKQHKGQGPLCAFTPVVPLNTNGPINTTSANRGGVSICLTARADITIDGSTLAAGQFAVNADTILTTSGQAGGDISILSTVEGIISAIGNAVTASDVAAGGRGGMIMTQAAEDIDVTGLIQAKGGIGSGRGGMIDMQAVNGSLGQPGGMLMATALSGVNGTIRTAECAAGPADPTSTPAAVALPGAACGVLAIFNPIPNKLPCGADCFCLEQARIRTVGGVQTLTIRGQGLKGVDRIDLNAPDCDPLGGTGITVFTTQTDTQITVSPFAGPLFALGSHVVLSTPAGPSSSCSSPCTSTTQCP